MDDDELSQFSQAFGRDLRSSDSGDRVLTELETIFEDSVFVWPSYEDNNSSGNSSFSSFSSNNDSPLYGSQQLYSSYAPPVESPSNDSAASLSFQPITFPFISSSSSASKPSPSSPSLASQTSSASSPSLASSSGGTPFEFQDPSSTGMVVFQNNRNKSISPSSLMFSATTPNPSSSSSLSSASSSSSYSMSSSKIERIIPFVEEMYRQLQSLRSGFIQNEEFLTSVSTHVATISQLLPNNTHAPQKQPPHQQSKHQHQQEFFPIPTTLKMLRAKLELRSEWSNSEIYLAQHFLNSNDILPQTRVVFKKKTAAIFHLQLRFGNEVLQVYEPAFLETTKKSNSGNNISNHSNHTKIKLEDDGGSSGAGGHHVWRYEQGTSERCELNSQWFPAFGQGRQVFFFLVCKYDGELYKAKILLAKKDYESQNNTRGSSSSDKKPISRERVVDLVLSITSFDDLKRELNATKRQRT